MIDDPLNRLSVKRGQDLPHSKLTDGDVRLIRQFVAERDRLKSQLKEMSNARLAAKFDVHVRTIDRVTANENWTHVL